ncbi:MAG: NAD(P)/FAD-dependent oxidoreductase [Akkermansiaceae bacterium]
MNNPQKVLIIGGGFAGLSCAQKLAGNADFQVTIIDRQNHHLFQPLLYQVATASLATTDIARSLRQILADADNVKVIMDNILSIDSAGQVATSKEESYSYDYLVMATGMKTSFFGNDQWSEHVIGLKSLADAYSVRKRVLYALETAERITDPIERKRLMTITIIGGGPTGVELAGAYADLMNRTLKSNYKNIEGSKLKVIIIEAAPRLLMPYSEDHSAYTKEHLESQGVKVMTDTMVVDVNDKQLKLKSGETIDTHTIIWAAGMEATKLLNCFEGAPRDRAGRITVEKDLSIPGLPKVFVVGDTADVTDNTGLKVPGVAPAASQMGRHIAKVMMEDLEHGEEGTVAEVRTPFTYWDKGMMAIIGKNAAVVKAGSMELRGWIAWMAWLFIHILFLVGFRNKLSVLLGWAFAYIGSKPGARVFTRKIE